MDNIRFLKEIEMIKMINFMLVYFTTTTKKKRKFGNTLRIDKVGSWVPGCPLYNSLCFFQLLDISQLKNNFLEKGFIHYNKVK